MYYIDTETCGLYSLPVLIQWAKDNGSVNLYNLWEEPIYNTLDLIEEFLTDDLCFFNASFDAFMLIKTYTTFSLVEDKNSFPEDIINEIAVLEERARFLDTCLKPKRVHDVMLHARKTKYQSLMDREDIKIRRVPTALAWRLAQELENRIKFDDIFFARSKEKHAPKWKIYDIKKPNGEMNPDFKDIKLKFKASSGLKNLYYHASKQKPKYVYGDIEVNRKYWPFELGYAPYALAVAPNGPGSWRVPKRICKVTSEQYAWPEYIKHHITHWRVNKEAREYAANDVEYTRWLYRDHFGSPEPGDVDSELAWMIAACRWRGFAIDVARLKNLKEQAIEKSESAPKAPSAVKRYIYQYLDETERLSVQSTKKTVLIELANWMDDEGRKHPAAIAAQNVLDARAATKEIELYDKLLLARRLHASFKAIGALSSRMSGADGLNPQGINHVDWVREAFPLADVNLGILADSMAISTEQAQAEIDKNHATLMMLNGGDFRAFEVSIAVRVFDDPKLDLALKTGKQIHALFGTRLNPGKTYEQIIESKGQAPDLYDQGKKGLFAVFYGGEGYTVHTRLNIPIEIADEAVHWLQTEYPGIGRFGILIQNQFSALTQTGGIGTRIEYKEPADYVESFLGFRRYFTLENKVIKLLYDLAQKPPASWKDIKVKVVRRERVQTVSGAVQSALYAAAFNIQSGNIRAAKNHHIQSPGAQITKACQKSIWDLQPTGVHQWIAQPYNVHDEIMCPTRRGYQLKVEEKVNQTVLAYREKVPLLAIDWLTDIANWKGKKNVSGASTGKPVQSAA